MKHNFIKVYFFYIAAQSSTSFNADDKSKEKK